jgi:hypothetical protein
MILQIRQFNYGINGGSASALLLGPAPQSAFDQRPYVAIEVGFSLWAEKPPVNRERQELLVVPATRMGRSFLLIGFIGETVVPYDQAKDLLADTGYRNKLAKMIANMVATAELASLDDSPLTFIQG